ncbi:unnamed protein product, partial [Closterium sp. Yama58-4]
MRSLAGPEAISRSDELLRIFLLACDTRQPRLCALGLSCVQKLVANNAVPPAALPDILTTLRE